MNELHDRDRIRECLMRDRAWNAYALGFLDPAFEDASRWFGTVDEAGTVTSLVGLYEGLSLPLVLTCGEVAGVLALLAALRPTLPNRFQFQVRSDHLMALEASYTLSDTRHKLRMALTREAYAPECRSDHEVVRLGHRDTAEIMALYRHYPDHFFQPHLLETGLYFGVKDGPRLASIAGIHVISDFNAVAAVGNLVTDPAYRGRGMAVCCTSRLLGELFERVDLATLNVDPAHIPSVRTFMRLGFTKHMRYLEGRAQR